MFFSLLSIVIGLAAAIIGGRKAFDEPASKAASGSIILVIGILFFLGGAWSLFV